MANLFKYHLQKARREKRSIAAFNVFNMQSIRGVVEAAEEVGQPVIVQPSVGTVKRLGVETLYAMIEGMRSHTKQSVILHLDHCGDTELAKRCIDHGWDAVMIDFSSLPLCENIFRTASVVRYAHARGCAVEGEVGVISGVEDDISHDTAHPATFEDTISFLKKTKVDAIAPSIGTAHGEYKAEPVLNYALLEQLAKHQETPLVLHGGTGLSDEQFLKLIESGIVKINLSTILKRTWHEALLQHLPTHKTSSPMDVDNATEKAIQKMASYYIRLFASAAV